MYKNILPKHKRPYENSPSRFLVDSIDKYTPSKNYPILEIACGYGRNSLYCSQLGYNVIAADFFDYVFDGWSEENNLIHPIRLDANSELPFKSKSFSAIVMIHFYCDDIFLRIKDLVTVGGLIIYESIGGNGNNWIQLSKLNEIRHQIESDFSIVYYKNKILGLNNNYETLKMIAIKKDNICA